MSLEQSNPHGFSQQTKVAKDGGSVAKAARNQLESQLGRSIISAGKASDYLLSCEPEEINKQISMLIVLQVCILEIHRNYFCMVRCRCNRI